MQQEFRGELSWMQPVAGTPLFTHSVNISKLTISGVIETEHLSEEEMTEFLLAFEQEVNFRGPVRLHLHAGP